jgi:hypothetical protein
MTKIVSALLILLMSLAVCSCDKASRQPTHKPVDRRMAEAVKEWKRLGGIISAHLTQLYGKSSTSSEEEQMADLKNCSYYSPSWLEHIIYHLDDANKRDAPVYSHVLLVLKNKQLAEEFN